MGGPELAGSGGREALEWAKLQKQTSKPCDVLLIGPPRPPRAPFALVQTTESQGVEFRIGTFKGGSDGGRDLKPVKWKMPEGEKDCFIDFDGRRWECWTGGGPPPSRGRPPQRDDPTIVVGPPPGTPGGPPPPPPPPPGGPGGPGPGPEGSPPPAPPPGEPPGTPPGDGPGTPPPTPVPPAVPPGDGPGQPPPAEPPQPPPEEPPGTPPPAPPPSNPPPREPPEPGDTKGKKPPYEPDPEPINQETPLQEEVISSSDTTSLNLMAASSRITSSAVLQRSFQTNLEGAFNVTGQLKSGVACCVTGEIEAVSFEQAIGGELSTSVGFIDLALSYFEGIRGTSKSQVQVCLSDDTIVSDTAEVRSEIDWQATLSIRANILEYSTGPLGVTAGLSTGVTRSQVVFEGGMSSLATFEIDEKTHLMTYQFGYFATVAWHVGDWSVECGCDASLGSVGSLNWENDLLRIRLGIALDF